MSNRKTPFKPNGHAGPQGRMNGHALASTERGGILMPRDQAASDDTRRASDRWCRGRRRRRRDSADAARYGLVSGGRLAGVGPAFAPARAWQARPYNSSVRTPHFVTGMPLGEQIARQVSASDQTSRAIHYQRLDAEAKKFFRPKKLPRRPR